MVPTQRRNEPAFKHVIATFAPEIAKLATRARTLVLEVLPEAYEVVWTVQKNVSYGKDDDYTVKDFGDYAYTCGQALAQSHARTGKTDGKSAEKQIDHVLDKDLRSDIEKFAVTEADHVTAQWKAFADTK